MNVRLSDKQKIHLLNTDDLFAIMQQVLLRENKIRRSQEHFWVVGLDKHDKILFIELIGLGANNRVGADPPDVFRMAIYKLAVKTVMVHNHPTGTLEPSQADIDFTDRLLKVGKLINIEVADHLIISEKDYLSFEDEGLMEQIRNSGLFEIVKRDQLEIKEWKMKLELERVEHEKAMAIAKKMLEDGVDMDTIKKYTGLRKWDIRKL